jgi:outer membrane protein OmpA-like peptidoglycan-associated protein
MNHQRHRRLDISRLVARFFLWRQNSSLGFLVVLLLLSPSLFSQANGNKEATLPTETITTQNYNAELLNKLIVKELNLYRISKNIDTFDISSVLTSTAIDLLDFEKEKPNTKNKNLKTQDILQKTLQENGGSGFGFDITLKKQARSSTGLFTYQEFASDLVLSWAIRTNTEKMLRDPKLLLAGVATDLSDNGRQVFVSVVFGSYLSENKGVDYISALPFTMPKNKTKLKPYDAKECRRVDRMSADFPELYAGLKNEGGEFVFEHKNARKVRPLLQEKNSGIFVDIIFPEQFLTNQYNLVDYSKVNRGIMTKEVAGSKLLKKNKLRKTAPKQINTSLGKVPPLPTRNYELNLVLVQNGRVCASIPPAFLVECSGEYAKPLTILADTVTINSEFDYYPKPDSTLLSFRIPFDKKKFTYKAEDIEPFLKLLSEPDFMVYEIKISAYSSIEGNMEENTILQQKRAESIVSALKSRQKENIISEIETKACWEPFQKDIQATKHNVLASMSLEEAREYIKKYNLNKELEPVLRNHRYAQIDIRVTYDIAGEKEQAFVLRQFHKALAEKNLPLALSIQKYIMKAVLVGQYPVGVIKKQQIPWDKPFAGLLMNNLYMSIVADGGEFERYQEHIDELHKLDPRNEYILFNNVLMKVMNSPISSETFVNEIQKQIQLLYYKTFTKETVDALNMKFQFKIIQSSDSVQNGQRLKLAAIERIKEIVDIRDESPENAMKLAEVFMSEKDYAFALELLDAFIIKENVNEQIVFSWLSLCSFFPDRMLTRQFANVLKKAYEINPNRTCHLFDGKHFSLRVFENPEVKKLFFEKCNKQMISNN